MKEAYSSYYSRVMLPRVVNGAYGSNVISEQRQRVVPEARGVVVEVGIGAGRNLPLYDSSIVERVIGIHPEVSSTEARGTQAYYSAKEYGFDVELRREPIADLTLDDDVADTVLMTYALCSINNAEAALEELRRVLKPGGRLLFCELGRARGHRTGQLQDKINPAWRAISGGCNINRNIFRLVQNSGFEVDFLDTYKPDFMPALMGYHYIGSATAQ